MLLGAAPAGLLQTHCPQHHSPEKTQIPPPKQEETGTKSTRDGKLREDSPFFFFFLIFRVILPFGEEQESNFLKQAVLIYIFLLTSPSQAHQNKPGEKVRHSHTLSSKEKQGTSHAEDTLMALWSQHFPNSLFKTFSLQIFYSAFAAQIATRKQQKAPTRHVRIIWYEGHFPQPQANSFKPFKRHKEKGQGILISIWGYETQAKHWVH